MRIWKLLQAGLGAALVSLTMNASAAPASAEKDAPAGATYTQNEIVNRAANFFGGTTEGLARAVERVFSEKGSPNAYITGVEGGYPNIAWDVVYSATSYSAGYSVVLDTDGGREPCAECVQRNGRLPSPCILMHPYPLPVARKVMNKRR